MSRVTSWDTFRKRLWVGDSIGLRLDYSRMGCPDSYFEQHASAMSKALAAMKALELGASANVSEGRMVGHYWLRAPQLAPDEQISNEIRRTVERIRRFAADIHDGGVRPQRSEGFYITLVIGVGGSALGPQLLADALGTPDDAMAPLFIDNTDPDGFDRVLSEIDESLDETLTIVISKSGGTKETRNAMAEVAAAYKHAGLNFAKHAVAVTMDGSELHRKATAEQWLATFSIWDWVGGRTSVTSAAGLLPAALQGIDVEAFLEGAGACDEATRELDAMRNPAAILALLWHWAGKGCGNRSMVVLPYRDRLLLLGRYLQQLVMESLGKAMDREGQAVHQGLTVYGNKGSTDQHALVQQLLEGRNDFFATFVQVLHDRAIKSVHVEPDVTSGDYLTSFLLGTREALSRGGRDSLTITLEKLDARALGALIALFERAVGLYAELINVNAYDQPGVEAGKKAAAFLLELQREVLADLRTHPAETRTCQQIAASLGRPDDVESVFHILEHAAANPDHNVTRLPAKDPAGIRYRSK